MYNSPYGNQYGSFIPQPINYTPTIQNGLQAQNMAQNTPQYVNGIESAKAYQLQPNEPFMYVKTADASGFCNIKTFRLTEVTDTNEEKYVTHDEFEKFKTELKKTTKKKDEEK